MHTPLASRNLLEKTPQDSTHIAYQAVAFDTSKLKIVFLKTSTGTQTSVFVSSVWAPRRKRCDAKVKEQSERGYIYNPVRNVAPHALLAEGFRKKTIGYERMRC